MFKPELLMPIGNNEMFFAALEGGADAVYAGLRRFNARGRAKNFSFSDIYYLTDEAHKHKKKVYITLNTLIKNIEIFDLIDTIHVLQQCNIDAIIFQDLAILNLVNKLYKNIELHASTQFGTHNSLGCQYLKNNNVLRTILSREINLTELTSITNNKDKLADVEIFIHGALCYSFSGQCLFSSYIGGYSANRGMCTQVCRRNFISENNNAEFFSLKDLQLIDYIPVFSDLKIKSLKIEGRMKSPDYVYNTAKAYRMAIDDHSKIPQAKELLKDDFAREKTKWFFGNDLNNAITKNTGTGIFVGSIKEISQNGFYIITDINILLDHKLRYRNNNDTEANFFKIKSVDKTNNKTFVGCDSNNLNVGDNIYIVGLKNQKNYSGHINNKEHVFNKLSQKQKQQLTSLFRSKSIKNNKTKIYLRIADTNLLKHSMISKFEKILIKIDLKTIDQLLNINLDNKFKILIVPELPKFISESQLKHYRERLKKLFDKNFTTFCVSHISQKELIPKNADIFANECVYVLNDIASDFLKSENFKEYFYPYENEYPNLLRGNDRHGIVPIYFHPELFYSRMPTKTGNSFKDENGNVYYKYVRTGFTSVIPAKPVSLTHNISKLESKGFNKFLIDFSYENNFDNLQNVLKSLETSQKIMGTGDFNMKKGLR